MNRLRRFLDAVHSSDGHNSDSAYGRHAADLALWLVIALPLALTTDAAPWLRLVGAPALALAVLVGRRAPLTALTVPVALGLAVTPELFTKGFTTATVALAFLLGRRQPAVRPLLLFCATLGAVGLGLVLRLPGRSVWSWFTQLVTVLFAIVLPWLLGRFRRQQTELARTGWELAERMEREQRLVADRTRLRERSRIAGDMHDSLGHDLSLIAVRAAALQVSPGLTPEARRSAGELRQAAAEATGRLHEIIGLLRTDGEPAPVTPHGQASPGQTTQEDGTSGGGRSGGGRSGDGTSPDGEPDPADPLGSTPVAALVDRAAASGVQVTLVRKETPGHLPHPRATAVEHALRRVVQEALTNATKHAPHAPVTVTLTRDADGTEVTVTNTRPRQPPQSPSLRHGTGLLALEERVHQAGGTFHAHPVDDGYTVQARFPSPGDTGKPEEGREKEREGGGTSRATTSREEHARARRRARRRILDAIWIPAAAIAVLGTLMYGFNLYTSYGSVLNESTYDRLRTGTPESDVTPRLPDYEFDDETPPEGAPADPPGTDECRFYRIRTFSNSPVYRLCFTDGTLSHKGRVSPDPTAP